jgi:hypothetical protein
LLPESEVILLHKFKKYNLLNYKQTMEKDFLNYEAPMVEVIEVEVEQGFAVSDSTDINYGGPYGG